MSIVVKNNLDISRAKELFRTTDTGKALAKLALECIKAYEDTLYRQKDLIGKAIGKIRKLSEENEKLKEKIKSMQKDLAWLSCLKSAGVDNWEGWDHARSLWREWYPEYNKD